METSRLPLSLTPPSPELETLVELLVDDELDAVERRALLERLDATDGGWKYCATAFLEAQTFRKAFRTFVDSERVAPAPFSDFDALAAFNDVSTTFAVADAVGATNVADATDATDAADATDATNVADATDAVAFAPLFAASRRDLPEPRIIPLNSSSTRGGLRRSFGSGGSGGDGPRRFPRFVATTAGLLLSVAFGALLYRQFAPPPSPARVPRSPRLDVAANVETPISGTPRRASAPAATSLATAAGNAAAGNAGGNVASSAPIRYVTLRSPSRWFDEVAVPCVEGDLDDLAALRATRVNRPDIPPQIAEALRTSGAGTRVQTACDEFRFPLEDGRTLVLPVDVYEIRAESISIN